MLDSPYAKMDERANMKSAYGESGTNHAGLAVRIFITL
jgi:hypothetical protein